MDLSLAVTFFSIATVVIAIAGTMLAKAADQLADLTGWGEAIFGALFLGSATSLPGIITSVTAAYNNYPGLAVSNAIGGIAAQTLFLSIADLSYRKINLEHAAASFANLMQGLLLMGLLSFILLGHSGPEIAVFGIHPFSALILLFYIAGFKMISRAKDKPMWKPRQTRETVKDVPDEEGTKNLSMKKVVIKFVALALIVAVAGYTVARAGIAIAEKSGLSESFVGTLFTAVSTSLPELIVAIAAVRQKSLTLAVSNIIGGNTFDVLFVAFADVAYRKGSILHAVGGDQVFTIALTLVMTSILILGLLHREKEGIAKIGWESFAIILIYLTGNAFLFFLN